MNSETIKGKWLEVRGELLNKWGKLTNDELDETKGNIGAIVGLIEQRYGEAKDAISETIHKMFGDAKDKVSDVKEQAGEALAETTENVKSDVRDATRDRDALN